LIIPQSIKKVNQILKRIANIQNNCHRLLHQAELSQAAIHQSALRTHIVSLKRKNAELLHRDIDLSQGSEGAGISALQ